MKAVIYDNHDAFEAAAPGAIMLWRYAEKKAAGGNAGHIMQKCVGCGESGGMLIYDKGTPKPSTPAWEVSGLPDAMTLSPSIHHDVQCCGWHGYLKNGEYSKA